MIGYWIQAMTGGSGLRKTLRKHFGGISLGEIVTASREFPVTSRVDVQAATEQWFSQRQGAKLLGVHSQVMHESPSIAHMLTPGPLPIDLGPLQYDEVDTGDATPARCLKVGLWLSRENQLPFALLLGPSIRMGQCGGVHVEIATPAGARGAEFSQQLFRDLELRIGLGRSYRGRVISLENYYDFSGRSGAVKVHRLHKVNREDVILPEKTLTLLDRNIGGFVAARDRIKHMRFSGKKGVLFYGPPGTGKTHTIHYLASQLPDHTTLLITAEQVAILGEYFRLARFLQPAMMIVEDVDLIARERGQIMQNPGVESLLNKLLNEMDGLREDADVLFILTTNRPDQIEPALASRPGRIDQAIEFPLPDAEGRRKLVKLYGRGLEIPEELLERIVSRTKSGSPAFIKELMRRSAQFQLEMTKDGILQASAVDAAFEEIVFAGGTLNLKLLGGEAVETGMGA